MKNIKLLACDLDGTLCDSQKNISPENLEAIAELRRRGIEFVPATGRVFGELPKILKENENIRYYITSNGSVIYDKLTGERHTFCVGKEKLTRLLDILDGYDNYIMLHAYGESYIDSEKDTDEYYKYCHMSDSWKEYIREFDVPRDNFREFSRSLDEMEMMCVFIAPDDGCEECMAKIEALGGLHVTSSDYHNIEFFNAEGGKGNSVLALASMLGIDKDEVAAAGDSLNDMSMILAAGTGIAAGNAREELKEAADVVACTNNEHIIKFVVENLLPPDPKKLELYLSQKRVLDTFLANHAITEAQYEKSLGDLTEKMGMQKYRE